ncbi:Uncharacterised protein [Vibrio cholerae]|nr:Uncharacterised protein [Vibrio cholerae]
MVERRRKTYNADFWRYAHQRSVHPILAAHRLKSHTPEQDR